MPSIPPRSTGRRRCWPWSPPYSCCACTAGWWKRLQSWRCWVCCRGSFSDGDAMAAYVIGEIEVTDPAAYEDYRKQVMAVVTKYGGRFIVRGGRVETLEGGWAPKRFVALEFPSMEQAQKFYRSPEYAPLIRLRQKASRGKLILVEGV